MKRSEKLPDIMKVRKTWSIRPATRVKPDGRRKRPKHKGRLYDEY